MGHVGEYIEEKNVVSLKNIKTNISKMQIGYIKERDKVHTQDDINDLTIRIDTLTQVLKLFPK